MQFNRKALLKAVQDARAAISQLPTEVTRPDEGR